MVEEFYKFRLFPNKKQIYLIDQIIDSNLYSDKYNSFKILAHHQIVSDDIDNEYNYWLDFTDDILVIKTIEGKEKIIVAIIEGINLMQNLKINLEDNSIFLSKIGSIKLKGKPKKNYIPNAILIRKNNKYYLCGYTGI